MSSSRWCCLPRTCLPVALRLAVCSATSPARLEAGVHGCSGAETAGPWAEWPAGSAQCPGLGASGRRIAPPLEFSVSQGTRLRGLELDSWLRGAQQPQSWALCVSVTPTSPAGPDWPAPCFQQGTVSSAAGTVAVPRCAGRSREDAASPVAHGFHIPGSQCPSLGPTSFPGRFPNIPCSSNRCWKFQKCFQ